MSGFNKNNKKARRALPEHDQVRLLDGLISGAGGGATASAYDGPLFSAPGHVPALAEVFENTRIALRKADQSGLDQISLVTSPQLAVKQFEIIQTLVGGAIACADTFRAYSAIAKLTAGTQQRQWALAWADVYKRSLFKSPEDYMRDVPVRITGDALPSKKLVGGKESLNFGSKHFILERDEISGWMCYTLYGRCEASFKSRVKEHLETAQRDATKAVGNFKDYVALREAIIACLPGMPDQLLTSTLRYAADNFYSAATMQGQRNERLVGLCKQATSTAVAVGKRLLSSLLQSRRLRWTCPPSPRGHSPAPTSSHWPLSSGYRLCVVCSSTTNSSRPRKRTPTHRCSWTLRWKTRGWSARSMLSSHSGTSRQRCSSGPAYRSSSSACKKGSSMLTSLQQCVARPHPLLRRPFRNRLPLNST